MEKFVVSARKYRPQNFNTVVGQSHITTTLKNAIRNQQLAHAFLFCGPRGVGKTTCARILAKTINCETPTPDGEACDQCQSCRSFNEGASLNIHELDAASNNSVDDIRTLVEQVRFAPQAGKYKVYIVDEVHMLSTSAFNAFLKTLEEPPSYAIFILATTEKHKILPTILSRCQIFDFKRITTGDTASHLEEICEKEAVKADMAALQLIAQKSEGCMRDALSIMDKIISFTNGELNYSNTLEHLNILDAEYYFRLMDAMMGQDVSGALLMFDEINRKGFEGDVVLNGLAEFIRNLLVSSDPKVVSLLDVVESFKERYMEMAQKINPSLLVSALNILSEAEIQFRSARNKKLHVELTLIKLCYLQQAIELADNSGQAEKKKMTDRPLAFRTVKLSPAARPDSKTLPGKIPAETAKKYTDSTHAVTAESLLQNPYSTTGSQSSGARLIIQPEKKSPNTGIKPAKEEPAGNGETAIAEKKEIPSSAAYTSNKVPGNETNPKEKLGSLKKLKEKLAKEMNLSAPEPETIPLLWELLTDQWRIFTDTLRASGDPSAQSFDLAKLRIMDEDNFLIVAGNNLELKFIEEHKRALADFLQEQFHNPRLQFYLTVEEDPDRMAGIEIPLSPREIFSAMAEKYPLVNELKIRLRLALD